MIRKLLPLFVFLLGIFAFHACSSKKEILTNTTVTDYYPVEIGKTVVYSMDSTVFVNFGTAKEVHKYQVMDVVDQLINDNLDRPSYRIRRYIRDSAGTQSWVDNASYMATPTSTSLEVIENNLRFIKLHQPFRDDYTWKGNSYIDTYSSNSTVDYLDDWDYVYTNTDQDYTVNNKPVPNTITVNQRDDTVGDPHNPNVFSRRDFSVEVYAKGIGLIYKDFLHHEYQPATPGKPAYSLGYGIKLTMLSHN